MIWNIKKFIYWRINKIKIEELEKEINDIEETLNNLKIKVEELKKNKNSFEPTPKGWEPKHGEEYWVAHYNLSPTVFFNDEIHVSEPIIKYNRIFRTKEECQLYCDVQRAFRNASKEFDCAKNNYYLYYCVPEKRLNISDDSYCKTTNLYFDSKKIIQKLINKFGEENVKRYYLEVY